MHLYRFLNKQKIKTDQTINYTWRLYFYHYIKYKLLKLIQQYIFMKKKLVIEKNSDTNLGNSKKKINMPLEKKSNIKFSIKQQGIQKGTCNLNKFSLKNNDFYKPFIKNKKQNSQLREQLYILTLDNLNTKYQTSTTNQQTKQDNQLKSIEVQEFEQKINSLKNRKRFEQQLNRNKNNRSCTDRYTDKKKSCKKKLVNSLDSKKRKSFKIEEFKINDKKQKNKSKKKMKIKIPKDIKQIKTPKSTPKSKKCFINKNLKSEKKKVQILNNDNIKQFNFQQNNKFNTKKITEVSDQQLQCSILKQKYQQTILLKKRFQKIKAPKQIKLVFNEDQKRKNKFQVLLSLKQKIKVKVANNYPNLSKKQNKLLRAIILIQRLWRQNKVKSLIGKFLSPRNSSEDIKKIENFKPQIKEYCLDIKKKQQSSSIKKFYQFYDRDTSFDSSDKKKYQKKMLNFVDSFREMVFFCHKKQKKANFFNFTTSLSQKCLMQKYYRKLFTLQSQQKSQQLNIKKLKQKLVIRKHPQIFKITCQTIQTQKIETEQQQIKINNNQKKNQDHISKLNPSKQFYKNQQILPKEKQNKIGLVIGNQDKDCIVIDITNILIQQFIVQFVPFYRKLIKRQNVKQNKYKLPGIMINYSTINNYLSGLIDHIEKYHKQKVIKNLNKIIGVNPEMLLKFLRAQNQEIMFIEENQIQNAQDEYSKGPVLHNDIFFEYQQIFEKQKFILKEQQKFANFLQTILKIHNKSIIDCFAEFLDQKRIYGIYGKPYPWQTKQFKRNYSEIKSQNFLQKLNEVKCEILVISQYGLGNLTRKTPFYQQIQEQNLLYVIKQQYNKQQKQWIGYQQQTLLIQLQISNFVFDYLIIESIKQL